MLESLFEINYIVSSKISTQLLYTAGNIAAIGASFILTQNPMQGRRNVFTTGLAKLDHEDYAIKRTMQLNEWVANNFMILFITYLLHNRVPCEHNNE